MKYLITLLLLIVSASNTWAQTPQATPQTTFEMELAKDAPVADEYAIALDYTINLLARLQTHLEQLTQGRISSFDMGATARDFYKLYAAGYLMCSINHGICQEFLDTILEIDLINSKISGKVSCINTLKMWKSWLDNDMEKRHSHHTKIVHVNEVSKFNKEERPKYHRCSKTIEGLIADSTISPAQFFKTRYAGDLKTENYVEKTEAFFKVAKEKNIDIFSSVDMD